MATQTLATNGQSPIKGSFIGQFDHVVSHFDGNAVDKDDISALPIAAALLNSAGLANKSTIFYNNNLSAKNGAAQTQQMRQSAAFAETKLGIDTYDYQANTNTAINALANILNSGKKVLILEGGPMEATYRALAKVSPKNRGNVTLVSHGRFNEVTGKLNWEKIRQDFPQVTRIEIADQNGKTDSTGFKSSKWNWLDKTSNPLLQEARDLMNQVKNKNQKQNDPSDAGMHFYAITGDEFGNPLDAKTFFDKYPPSRGGGSSNPKPSPKSNPQPKSNSGPNPDSNAGDRVILHAMDPRRNPSDPFETPITDGQGNRLPEAKQYKNGEFKVPQNQVFWGDIQISGKAANGNRGIVKSTHDLIGIKSYSYSAGNFNKSKLDNAVNHMGDEGGTETLSLKFADTIEDVTLKLASLDNPNEQVLWKAFNAKGNSIGQGTLKTTNGTQIAALDADELNFGKNSTYQFDLPKSGIARLELRAAPNTGYSLAGIAYTVEGGTSPAPNPQPKPNPKPSPKPNPNPGTNPGNDNIVGTVGNDTINGGAGNDKLRGDPNNTQTRGGLSGGNDIINGGSGNDEIIGRGGNDRLTGGSGNDRIAGDAGDDIIRGGLGKDALYGGSDRDTFVLAKGEGTDTILDFEVGKDRLGLEGNLSFGQLTIEQANNNTLISVGNETLANLRGVDASDITKSSVITV